MMYKVCPVCRDVFVSADHFSHHQTIMHPSPSSVTTGTTIGAPLTPITTATVVMSTVTMMTVTMAATTIVSSSNDTTTTTTMDSNVTTTTSISITPAVTMTTDSISIVSSDVTMTTTCTTTVNTGSTVTKTVSMGASSSVPTSTFSLRNTLTQDFLPLEVTAPSSSMTCAPQHDPCGNPPSLPPILHDNCTNLISPSCHTLSQATTPMNCPVIIPNTFPAHISHSSAIDKDSVADLVHIESNNTCCSESTTCSNGTSSLGDAAGENSVTGELPKEDNFAAEYLRKNSVTNKFHQENGVTGKLPGENIAAVSDTSQLGSDHRRRPVSQARRKKLHDLETRQDDHRVC